MTRAKLFLPAMQLLAVAFFGFLFVGCESRQEQVSLEDYQRAERFLASHTTPLVHNVASGFGWLDDDRLTYRLAVDGGHAFMLADPATGDKTHAFDHERLARALSDAAGEEYEPFDLPFNSFRFSDEHRAVIFSFGNTEYTCSLEDYSIESRPMRNMRARFNEAVSPDGRRAVYIEDHNLWLRDTETDARTQLTFDGQEDYGYGTNNAGWSKRDRPVVLWSPDSRRIASFRHDSRGTKDMYLVSTAVGHGELQKWKYPLPGDSLIFRIERVVINLEAGPRLVRLQMEPDMHRSSLTDHVADRAGDLLDAEWSEDGSMLAFVSTSRDHKVATLRVADPVTGRVRNIIREEMPSFIETGHNMRHNWRLLQGSNEVIWFSQRYNWGHLYLYDLVSGAQKNRITTGDWNVINVVHLDEAERKVWFTGTCREPGNAYFHYLYSVGLDGGGLKLLTPEPANHSISLSESKNLFVDTYSTPDTPPVSVVRDMEGELVMELEKADISALEAMGWVPPIEFSVLARDGETELWGLMYQPSNLRTSGSYPVLCYIYPGPQGGSVGNRSFRASRSDKQALAELGFIVVEVDAMGTPGRSKEFHDAYYGNMGDNGLPDQITMIEQLAGRYRYMDIGRVGIFGHSGGGFASTRAILEYPDFFKVAVSSAGNHDNRNYTDDWGEKWQGLLQTYTDEDGNKTTNYDNQANQLLAENLKGKLLITHGTLDANVPPYNTYLVVDALIAANKDFDMIMFPNRGHGYYAEPYMMRQRWDYFVRHLKGAEPPKEYVFGELE
jgi:dipeptidyl aminopeptidase/acylaminoacyl peptidase